MASRKAIGLIIGAIAIMGLLVPLLIIQPAIKVDFDLNATDTMSTYSVSFYGSPTINQVDRNAYEKLLGDIGASGGIPTSLVTIEILVNLELETPSGQNISLSFNPLNLRGTGLNTLTIFVDVMEVGTFNLTVEISVSISVFGFGTVNQSLPPVSLSFAVV